MSQKWAAVIFAGSMAAVFGLTFRMTQTSGEHYERILEYGCPLLVLASVAFFLLLIRWQGGKVQLTERIRKSRGSWMWMFLWNVSDPYSVFRCL